MAVAGAGVARLVGGSVMAESWVRLWSGMTTDPKWQTVARKSGQPRYLVIGLLDGRHWSAPAR